MSTGRVNVQRVHEFARSSVLEGLRIDMESGQYLAPDDVSTLIEKGKIDAERHREVMCRMLGRANIDPLSDEVTEAFPYKNTRLPVSVNKELPEDTDEVTRWYTAMHLPATAQIEQLFGPYEDEKPRS